MNSIGACNAPWAWRTAGGLLAVTQLLLPGCGQDGPMEPAPAPDPVAVAPGEIGVLAGTGQRGTDPIAFDGDGLPEAIPQMLAKFDTPLDVTVAPDGRIHIVDWNGHKVRVLREDGRVAPVVGTGIEGDACEVEPVDGDCPALFAQVNHPTDVIFDADGRLVVAAWHNSKIKRLDPDSGLVEDVCGTGARKFTGDGGPCRDEAGEDRVDFDLPSGVVYDADGNLLIADQANQVIRRLGTDGVVATVVGHCPTMGGFGCPQGRGYAGDGGPATEAQLANNLGQGTDPQGKIAMDQDGYLYIADTGNHVVRRVDPGSDGILGDGDPAEEIITTVAGTGEAGHSGDDGLATETQLSSPTDVAIGPDGSLYIADRGNSCIRRVSVDGMISTAAGTCGEEGNGGSGVLATTVGLRRPYGITVHGDHLYIADTLNHCIRQVVLEP